MLKGFREFIMRGNVVDLAVAVIIGAAFGAVVTKLVADLITPLIAAIGGQPDFSKLSWRWHNSTFLYGDFINKTLAFAQSGFAGPMFADDDRACAEALFETGRHCGLTLLAGEARQSTVMGG